MVPIYRYILFLSFRKIINYFNYKCYIFFIYQQNIGISVFLNLYTYESFSDTKNLGNSISCGLAFIVIILFPTLIYTKLRNYHKVRDQYFIEPMRNLFMGMNQGNEGQITFSSVLIFRRIVFCLVVVLGVNYLHV